MSFSGPRSQLVDLYPFSAPFASGFLPPGSVPPPFPLVALVRLAQPCEIPQQILLASGSGLLDAAEPLAIRSRSPAFLPHLDPPPGRSPRTLLSLSKIPELRRAPASLPLYTVLHSTHKPANLFSLRLARRQLPPATSHLVYNPRTFPSETFPILRNPRTFPFETFPILQIDNFIIFPQIDLFSKNSPQGPSTSCR